MISDPRIPAIAFGNVTWKMVLRCRWVGGDEETGEEDARLDRRQQPLLQWVWTHCWLCACALEAAPACQDFVHVEIGDFDMSEPACGCFESPHRSCLASHLLRAREF